MLRKRSVMAIKVETTAGTAESLTASEGAFNAYDVEITPEIAMTQRPGQGSLSQLAAVHMGRGARMTFELDLYTLAPWASSIFPSCRMKATSDVYTPSSVTTDWKTVTIGKYMDGKFYHIYGAMGTFTLLFRPGQVTRVRCEYRGIWAAPTDVAILAPTYPLTAPPRFAASTLTLGAYTPRFSELDIAMNNQVQLLESATDAAGSGFSRAHVTDGLIGGTINPEEDLVATHDAHGIWIAGTQSALSIAYGDMSISVPKLQYTNVPPLDRNGMAALAITWQANRSAVAGDDELSIDMDTSV